LQRKQANSSLITREIQKYSQRHYLLSELLLLFDTTAYTEERRGIQRLSAELYNWLLGSDTGYTKSQHSHRHNKNPQPPISKTLIQYIIYLIWLLLPIIASVLNNSWQAPRQKTY